MKTTYLLEFFVFPHDQKKQRAIYLKAQTETGTTLSENQIRAAVAAIAAHDIPEMKPLEANPGKLVGTAEEEPPVQYLRHQDHPGVIVWESNRGPQTA